MEDTPCLHTPFGYWGGCRDNAHLPFPWGVGPAALPSLLFPQHGRCSGEGPGQPAPRQGNKILGWGVHQKSTHMPLAGDVLCPPLPVVLPALLVSTGAGDQLQPEEEATLARA